MAGISPVRGNAAAILLAAVTGLALCPRSADADTAFYLSGALGGNFAPDVLLRGADTDRAARCDEFVNPRYAEIDACLTPKRSVGAVDHWRSRFDRAGGLFAGIAAGLQRGPLRAELELHQRTAGYDASAPIHHPDGEPFTAIFGAELPQAEERLGALRTRSLFANAYWRFPNASAFTPYVGVGAGVADTRLEYRVLWRRSDDPGAVRTAAGLPNEEQVRRNLAGTVSRAEDELRDTLRGYQLLFGVEYEWRPKLSLAFQARWARFEDFEDGGDYDALRSHVSNLRRDGSEPVVYRVYTGDVSFGAVSLAVSRRL